MFQCLLSFLGGASVALLFAAYKPSFVRRLRAKLPFISEGADPIL